MGNKKENAEDISLNMELTRDKNQLLILDSNSDSLVARLSFYKELPNLKINDEQKLRMGHHLMTQIYRSLYEKSPKGILVKEAEWNSRANAFKDAYYIHEHKNEVNVVWLMTTMLRISEEEAKRRFSAGQDLLSHPEFKDKEDMVVDKIYTSSYHLEEKVD